jgi:hypothetical protein
LSYDLLQVKVTTEDELICKEFDSTSTLGKTVLKLAKGSGCIELIDTIMMDSNNSLVLEKKFLKVIEDELEDLCSKKKPSILRSTPTTELHALSMEKICEELQSKDTSLLPSPQANVYLERHHVST